MTPVAADLVGVAVLTRPAGSLRRRTRRVPRLRRAAGRDAEHAGAVRGRGPAPPASPSARVAGRVLLVGDAAGYVDALTGEGIALALAPGAGGRRRASPAATSWRYEREWRRLTRRYRWLTHALLGATRVPPARAALVPLAQRLPWLFSATVDALARPAGQHQASLPMGDRIRPLRRQHRRSRTGGS